MAGASTVGAPLRSTPDDDGDDEPQLVAEGGSLPPSKEYQEIEVRNVLRAMNILLHEVALDERDHLVTPDLILRFHRMIGKDLGEHIDAIQASQFEYAWRSFVHDRFAERQYTKKTVFKRRRGLMLSFPIGETVPFERIPIVNPTIARAYAQLSERTLRRDLEILVDMELLLVRDGSYQANASALRLQMARRLKRDAWATPGNVRERQGRPVGPPRAHRSCRP